MNKKILISCLIIILFLLYSSKSAYAYNDYFKVISSSDNEYTYKIKTINNNDLEYSQYCYVGQKLNDYIILNIPESTSLKAGTVKWENPDYIIVDGEQVVNVIFTNALTGEDTIFKVYINGAPLLTVNNLYLQDGTVYDVNIIGKTSHYKYEWYSEDDNIVTVDSYGYVKAIKNGKTNVRCRIMSGEENIKDLICKVNVVSYDEYPDISLTQSEMTLSIGEEYNININNKKIGCKYNWFSSDNDIIRLDSTNGMINAVGQGSAIVTCAITFPDNTAITLRCDVTVK